MSVNVGKKKNSRKDTTSLFVSVPCGICAVVSVCVCAVGICAVHLSVSVKLK